MSQGRAVHQRLRLRWYRVCCRASMDPYDLLQVGFRSGAKQNGVICGGERAAFMRAACRAVEMYLRLQEGTIWVS